MHLELIKVTKDLRQDGRNQAGDGLKGFNGDLSGWIEHFKQRGIKTYLGYGVSSERKDRNSSGKKTCALYREVLPNDREDVVYLKNAAEKVLATELSSVEGYVYPRKG